MFGLGGGGDQGGITAQDRQDFEVLDRAVRRGIKAIEAVREAGRALAAIRDRQLYRVVADTFEAYARDHHGLTARRLNQMIRAAAIFDAIDDAAAESGTTVPELSERSIRDLSSLDPEAAAAAVIEAVDADGGSPAAIKAAAKRRRPRRRKPAAPKPWTQRVPGASVKIIFNRKSDGSVLAALAAATAQAEAQLIAQQEAEKAADGHAEAA